MATRQPAMSPSDLPVADVLNRATGPRRAETDELVPAFADRWPELLDTLGKHRASTGCLYLTRLTRRTMMSSTLTDVRPRSMPRLRLSSSRRSTRSNASSARPWAERIPS